MVAKQYWVTHSHKNTGNLGSILGYRYIHIGLDDHFSGGVLSLDIIPSGWQKNPRDFGKWSSLRFYGSVWGNVSQSFILVLDFYIA